MNNIYCNKCKTEFTIKQFIQEHDIMRDGTPVVVSYFCCPVCDKKYITEVTSEKTESLRASYFSAIKEHERLVDLQVNEERIKQHLKDVRYHKNKYRRCAMRLRKQYMKRVRNRGY